MTTILFCSDPLARGQPDPAFLEEAATAARAGCVAKLLSYERLMYEQDGAGQEGARS